MKLLATIASASLLITTSLFLPAKASSICNELDGATVVAGDGTYLGKMESAHSSDSIFNEYGTYGSQYSSKSIWNEYGQYGGKYSINSPFNEYSSSPPVIYTKTNKTSKLTMNKYLPHTVNPYSARACFL